MRSTPIPSVDVLIAAWNRADTIERAVSSALGQPEVRTVIVVDDGSTDDTAACAERAGAGSGRVVVRRLPSNSGPSTARNHGLEISNAPWIAVLDGDDYFLPGRIAKLLSLTEGWDFVADDILLKQDPDGGKTDLRPMMFDRKFVPWSLDLASFVLGNSGSRGRSRREFGYLKPLMRRCFLAHHCLRYDERFRLGEDYALYTNALALGARFLVTPAYGYVSVVRPNSLSARHGRRDLERLRDVDTEFLLIPTISDRDCRALRTHYRSVDARVQWINVIEAIKARSLSRFLLPFARSPAVTMFLARKLTEETCQRLIGAFHSSKRSTGAHGTPL